MFFSITFALLVIMWGHFCLIKGGGVGRSREIEMSGVSEEGECFSFCVFFFDNNNNNNNNNKDGKTKKGGTKMGVHSCPSLLIILHKKYEERAVFIFSCGIKVKIMNSDFVLRKSECEDPKDKENTDMSVQD